MAMRVSDARGRASSTGRELKRINTRLSSMDRDGTIRSNPEWQGGMKTAATRAGEFVTDTAGRFLRMTELARIANKRRKK